MPRPVHQLTRALALLAAAGLCAALANTFAPHDRKLAWAGRAPEAVPDPSPAAPRPEPTATPSAPSITPPPPLSAAHVPARKPVDLFPPQAATAVREISSTDAWSAFGRRVLFLDARRTADFADGHVKGAWSAPVWEEGCDRRLTEFEAQANPGMKDPIVIYCSGGCEDSRLLAAKLQALGYRNLLIYTEGFPDWTAQSRPVEKGARR